LKIINNALSYPLLFIVDIKRLRIVVQCAKKLLINSRKVSKMSEDLPERAQTALEAIRNIKGRSPIHSSRDLGEVCNQLTDMFHAAAQARELYPYRIQATCVLRTLERMRDALQQCTPDYLKGEQEAVIRASAENGAALSQEHFVGCGLQTKFYGVEFSFGLFDNRERALKQLHRHIVYAEHNVASLNKVKSRAEQDIKVEAHNGPTGDKYFLFDGAIIVPVSLVKGGHVVYRASLYKNGNKCTHVKLLPEPSTVFGSFKDAAEEVYRDAGVVVTVKGSEKYPLNETALHVVLDKYQKLASGAGVPVCTECVGF
jgi:hypothetical protein